MRIGRPEEEGEHLPEGKPVGVMVRFRAVGVVVEACLHVGGFHEYGFDEVGEHLVELQGADALLGV